MTVCGVSDFLLDGYLKIVTITILFTGCYKGITAVASISTLALSSNKALTTTHPPIHAIFIK